MAKVSNQSMGSVLVQAPPLCQVSRKSAGSFLHNPANRHVTVLAEAINDQHEKGIHKSELDVASGMYMNGT